MRRRAAWLAVAAVAAALLFIAGRVRLQFGGNWTGVFCTGAIFRVPADLEAGTYRFPGAGYDGQFYRYLAHDPLLTKGYALVEDSPRLRSRRALVSWSAWLLAAGQSRWIDGAFVAVELIFCGLGVYWSARLVQRRGRPAVWGLLFLAVPATMTSLDRMLTDGPLCALFAGFVLYCEEQRRERLWWVCAAAALTRDTGWLLAAGMITDAALRRNWRQAAAYTASLAPAALWYGFVAAQLPPSGEISLLAPPGWGLLRRLLWLRPYPVPSIELLLRVTDALAVAGLAISLWLAARWAWRAGISPVTLSIWIFVALGLLLGSPDHLLEAFGFARPVSPLLLWLMLEAVGRRMTGAIVPPLMVSLSVAIAVAAPVCKALLAGAVK